jgi:hypothetical protein
MLLTQMYVNLHHNIPCYFLYFYYFSHGVRESPLGTAATPWSIAPTPDDDDDDCGAISGIRIDRGNRSTQRKLAPIPLCPPQNPHDLTRARTSGRGGKPATNRLSYGRVIIFPNFWAKILRQIWVPIKETSVIFTGIFYSFQVNFTAFDAAQMFIILFTTAQNCNISWARWTKLRFHVHPPPPPSTQSLPKTLVNIIPQQFISKQFRE